MFVFVVAIASEQYVLALFLLTTLASFWERELLRVGKKGEGLFFLEEHPEGVYVYTDQLLHKTTDFLIKLHYTARV